MLVNEEGSRCAPRKRQDVSRTYSDTTQLCRKELLEKIGEERFDLWFQQKSEICVEGSDLVVFGDPFTLEWIARQFRTDLKDLAQSLFGELAKVRFMESKLGQLEANKDDNNCLPQLGGDTLAKDTLVKSAGAESKVVETRNPKVTLSDRGDLPSQSTKTIPLTDSIPVADKLEKPTKSEKSIGVIPIHKQSHSRRSNEIPAAAENLGPKVRRKRRDLSKLSSFVVGQSNELAFGAAQNILSELGAVSPLLIHAPTGCGKSHILEGIARSAREDYGLSKVLGTSSFQFVTDFLEALRQKGMPMFRKKYRELDVLLIDDIQAFHGKKATVVELLQTLDSLLRSGAQVIMSSDRSLAELEFLGPELTTRISCGLVCKMELPEFETRCKIVQRFARDRQLTISPSVERLIAQELCGDARQILGAINRLKAFRSVSRSPLTTEKVAEILDDLFRSSHRVPSLVEIEKVVCDVFGVEAKVLRSNKKAKTISEPRALAMWLSRKYTRAALSEIGDHYGGRSHSTVISANRKVENWMEDGRELRMHSSVCPINDAVRRIQSQLNVG